MRSSPDAKVLGQLLLMQSIINNLPTKESILGLVERGLSDIPGVENVRFVPEVGVNEKDIQIVSYPVEVEGHFFGTITLHISNANSFEPYQEYISNFVFMLAVILEERRKSKVIEKYKDNLETKVQERALQLSREIDAKNKIQHHLVESERKYRLLATNSIDLISLYNIKGVITYVSPSVRVLLGYDPGELVGKKITEFIHGDDINRIKNIFVFKPKQNDEVYESYRIRNRAGTYIWIESTFKIIRNPENGKVKELQSSSRDITERKYNEAQLANYRKSLEKQNADYQRINQELLDSNVKIQQMIQDLISAKQKAEESDNLKTSFLANINHEIRTPLNGIMGFSNLFLRNHLSDEKKKMYAKIVVESSHQLLNVFDDILDYSSIENGTVTLDYTQTNLSSLTDDLEVYFRELAGSKNLKLNVVKSKDKDTDVYVDHNRLRQILTHLLNNALKFTHKGVIEIGYTLNEKDFTYYVKDSGLGIPQETQDIIFDRFRRVEPDLTKLYGGTGLGLAICKRLCEKMNGTIRVESEKNKGSCFYVNLPRKKSEIEYVTKNTSKGDKTLSVLVAEDEALNFNYIQEVLSEFNVKLYHAQDGLQAVKLFKKNTDIDLVLMDIRMPKLNGYEATKQILSVNPNMPVIAQTAYSMEKDKELAKAAGCIDYLTKPLRRKDLMSVIEKYKDKIRQKA
jgi:PAS domain S-box-containing protein